MTTYRFVQGIDYGPRDGTLGLSFHMAEGGDGTLGYLRRHAGEDLWEWAQRVNGVSCNALLLETGEVVQMLDWSHASGNNNPDDRAGEYGYYGHHHLVDVLGDHWPDPNTWQISMEICGYRGGGAPVPDGVTPGPNDKQVAAAIAWGKDMIRRWPSIRGTNGHHDQSPKACPGLTANMKAIFEGLGGHGLWPKEVPNVAGPEVRDLVPFIGKATIKSDGVQHGAILANDGSVVPLAAGTPKDIVAKARFVTAWPNHPDTTVYLVGSEPAYLLAGDVSVAAVDPVADVKKKAAAMVRSDSETTALKIEAL